MTLDPVLYRIAGARCAAAGLHREAGEDWPCTRHLMEAAQALAAASSTVGGPPTAPPAVLDGAADPRPLSREVAAPPSEVGTYYVVAEDIGCWLVVGIHVGGCAWVAGRWDTRAAAETSAAEWTALTEQEECF